MENKLMKKEDENLKKAINEFLEGNTSSFDDIYKFSSKYVYTCISKIVKDEELIKDIMQETYIEVIAIKRAKRVRYPLLLNVFTIDLCVFIMIYIYFVIGISYQTRLPMGTLMIRC